MGVCVLVHVWLGVRGVCVGGVSRVCVYSYNPMCYNKYISHIIPVSLDVLRTKSTME